MEEIWKDIEGYEGLYIVSTLGRVKSLNYHREKREQCLKPHLNTTNHCQVTLRKNGKNHYLFVHRIVWEAFVGPIPEGMQINHIDENPINNRLDNLNLMTPKENTNWGSCIERRSKKQAETIKGKYVYNENPNAKPILQYSLDGKFIEKWECAKYAIEKYNLNQPSLSAHLHGKTKSCGGYKWYFA